jgi:transposase
VCDGRMPRAYSVDLRERSLRALASGMPAAEIERSFGVSRSSLARWRRAQAAGRALRPGCSSGRPRAIPPPQEPDLRAQAAAHPDATLGEHCARWHASHGVRVSAATMSRMLARLGLALKKRRSSPPNKTRPNAPPGTPRSPASIRPR